jgi:hypothetical protein
MVRPMTRVQAGLTTQAAAFRQEPTLPVPQAVLERAAEAAAKVSPEKGHAALAASVEGRRPEHRTATAASEYHSMQTASPAGMTEESFSDSPAGLAVMPDAKELFARHQERMVPAAPCAP